VAGIPETEECETLSPLLEALDVPGFTSSTGKLGRRGSTADEYGNIYRMLAPNSEIVNLLIGLVGRFNFSKVALLYDPEVFEEEHLMHDLTEASSLFVPYAVRGVSMSEVNEVFDSVLDTGVMTFVCIFQHPATMNAVVSHAYARGIVGKKSSAIGFAWIAAGGYMPWGYSGAHRDHYLGMMSVEQHPYDDDAMDIMKELWSGTMPHQCTLAPEKVAFTTPDRNHLPYEECLGLAGTYDSIAAIALGLATKLDIHTRRLGTEQSTSASPMPECINSRASALNEALHLGVNFDGLSGLVERHGEPWAEKDGRWEVANLQTSAEGGHPVILYEWTKHAAFIDHRRRLGDSSTSSSAASGGQYLWPGNTRIKPEGVIHSPCEHVDCGSHGSCQDRPAVARNMGWCLCDAGYIGAQCETLHEPYRLSDHPGLPTHKATVVETMIFINAFLGIQDKFPSGYKTRFDMVLRWTDERVVHLKTGLYSLDQAESLQTEGVLWLPAFEVRDAANIERLGGVLRIADGGELQMVVACEVTIEQDLEWEHFPFDAHDLQLSVREGNPVDTEFHAMNCSSEILIERVVAACAGSAEEGGFPGIPKEVAEQHWARAWTLEASESAVMSTRGGRSIVQQSITVSRKTNTFIVRIMFPSIFLVVISWGGFYISPKALMPRFASGFISFLSLQSFSNKVQAGMPGDLASMTWIDVYMSVVGMLMVFAVIENIYAQFVYEHQSEKCALRVDRTSRVMFPATLIVVVTMLIVFRKEVTAVNIVAHLLLALFAVGFIILGVQDRFTYISRTMRAEAKRIHDLKKAQDPGEDLPVFLDLTAREIQSMFNLLDRDRSGFVGIEEVLPFILRYFPVDPHEDVKKRVEELTQAAVGVNHVHGMQVGGFKDMMLKAVDIIVNERYKADADDQGKLGI